MGIGVRVAQGSLRGRAVPPTLDEIADGLLEFDGNLVGVVMVRWHERSGVRLLRPLRCWEYVEELAVSDRACSPVSRPARPWRS